MVSVKCRALVFVAVTVVVLATMYIWEASPHPGSNIYPRPYFLGSTWYGPLLLLLIPGSLGWLSWGARRGSVRVIGLMLTVLVTVACIHSTIVSIQHVRPFMMP